MATAGTFLKPIFIAGVAYPIGSATIDDSLVSQLSRDTFLPDVDPTPALNDSAEIQRENASALTISTASATAAVLAHNGDAAAHGAQLAVTQRADWFRGLARARAGGGCCHMLWLGDSWTAMPATYWLGKLTKMVKASFGGTNPGYISFNAIGGQPGADATTPTVTVGSGWTKLDYPTSRGIDGTEIKALAAANASVSVQLAAGTTAQTPVLLFNAMGASGSFRYRFNGGGWTTFTVSSPGFVSLVLPGAGVSNWLWEAEIVDAGDGFEFFGINAISGGGSYPVIHNAAGAGWGTDNYRHIPAPYFAASLVALAPDVVCIFLGTNDRDLCISASDISIITDNLQTVIARIRGVKSWQEIAIVMPPENYRGLVKPISMAEMSAAFRAIAEANNCRFVDLQPHFGAELADYGNDTRQLILSSNPKHPTPDGSNAVAAAIWGEFFAGY